MILNKEILIELVIQQCVDEDFCKINGDTDYLHDVCLYIDIGGLNPEENVILYGELLSVINVDGKEIGYEIDEFFEEEYCTYYGDPAFASARDYWNYILG